MTHEALDEMLSQYSENKARCDFLKATIAKLRQTLQNAKQPSFERVLTGMPHGSGVADPTARYGVLFAEGWLPEEAQEIASEIKRYEDEYAHKIMDVDLVDAIMSGLTEREQFVIKSKCLNGRTWHDLEGDFEKRYGYWTSRSTLKRAFHSAKQKMYAITE